MIDNMNHGGRIALLGLPSVVVQGQTVPVVEGGRLAGIVSIGDVVNVKDGYARNFLLPNKKALRANDRLGGHIVSGHVDGIGTVTRFERVGESWELCVMAPPALGKYLAYKGSITVNGVSLTVNRVADSTAGCEFSINLIPHTVEHTALGQLQAGHAVNLEIDTVARYVERMLGATPTQDNA